MQILSKTILKHGRMSKVEKSNLANVSSHGANEKPPSYEKNNVDYKPVEKEGYPDEEEALLPAPAANIRPRRWGFPFFSCFEDCFTFCCAAAVPAAVYGRNKQRANHDDECCMYTGLYCIVDVATAQQCGCVLVGLDRQALRQRQSIPGTLVEDLAVATFCLPCALTQQKLELDVLDGTRIPTYAQGLDAEP